ncbi:unnamed protein product, partial [Rotaria sordida]
MLTNRTTISNSNDNNNNNNNNNHRRQWSESSMTIDKSMRLYKDIDFNLQFIIFQEKRKFIFIDDDRQLIQSLVNEYLLEGSNDVLDLIRNCPNECFEALADFIWNAASQTMDSNEDDLSSYNQRARRRLAIIFIEIFKLLATSPINGDRFDIQQQNRILLFPSYAGQLIHFEPDIYGLSCLTLASIILINPNIIHHRISLLIDALKRAVNHFVKANLSFDAPSTFALSIYSLFDLLYLLYPNNLRRELQ